MQAESVTAHLVVDKCLVWDKTDVDLLRSKYRVVGVLIGNKQQTNGGTCPLLLQSEEVTLGIERGWLNIIDDSVPYRAPSTEEIVRQQKDKEEERLSQRRQYVEKRGKETLFHRVNASGSSKKPRLSENPLDSVTDAFVEQSQEKVDQEMYDYTRISASTDVRYWQREDRMVSVEEWRSIFPKNELEGLRYRVFRDLWDKGYFISPASKFGGDFLVYPGDPCDHHSLFVVLVVTWKEFFSPFDMTAFGRLGVGVRKAPVLASLCPSRGEVQYITLHWRGVT